MRAAAVVLLLSLLLSGCTFAFKDIDKRFFVSAMGIDKTDNPKMPYKISLMLGIPTSKVEAGEEKFQVIRQEAESISQAVRLVKSKVDKELDFGHTKTFILGKALAEDDLTQAKDWLSRRRDFQLIAYLAVGDPDAESILQVSPPSERFPGNTLFLTFSHDGVQSSYIQTAMLFDFYRRTHEKGLDPFLPVIKPDRDKFEVNRVALLDKHKIKYIASPNETQLLDMFAKKGFHKFTLHTRIDSNLLAFSVTDCDAKFGIVRTGSTPAVNITLDLKGIVEETNAPPAVRRMNEYEKALENEVNTAVKRLIRKLISRGVDPIGFGLRYRADRTTTEEEWRRWQAGYRRLPVEVSTRVHIEGTGVLK